MSNTIQSTGTYADIDYGLLVPADDNVRADVGDVTDLSESILMNGLISPLAVRQLDDGRYLIVAGHRRHAAITQLRDGSKSRFKTVPCMIRTGGDDGDRVAEMLVENLQRSDLNPVEEGIAFLRLTKEFGYKRDELAIKIGRSPSYVNARITILKLPEQALNLLRHGGLTLDVALKLAQVGNDAKVEKLLKSGKYTAEHHIENAIKETKAETLRDRFIKKLDALEVPHTFDRPPFHRVTTLETDNPADVDALAKIPKNATAYISVDPWRGTCTLTIGREMTEAEKAKRQAADEATRTKANEEWQAERAKQIEAERAAWSPEFRAWKEACAEVEHANAEAVKEYDEQVRVAQLKYARSLDAKRMAKEAMVEIVKNSGLWYELAAIFGLEYDGWAEAQTVVVKHVTDSAANLVAAVGICLAWDDHEALAEEFDAAAASVPAPATLPLPVYEQATEEAAA